VHPRKNITTSSTLLSFMEILFSEMSSDVSEETPFLTRDHRGDVLRMSNVVSAVSFVTY
jgi:hypothetical protein